MAEQLSLFGIVVGIALLLSGIGFAILAIGGALRNPETELPFLDVLVKEAANGSAPSGEELARYAELAVGLVQHLRQEVRNVDFWRNTYAQNVLRTWIVRDFLDSTTWCRSTVSRPLPIAWSSWPRSYTRGCRRERHADYRRPDLRASPQQPTQDARDYDRARRRACSDGAGGRAG